MAESRIHRFRSQFDKTMNVKLNGMPALIALATLLAGVAAVRSNQQSDLQKDPKVREQLSIHLQSKIANAMIEDTEAISKAIESGNKKAAHEVAESLTKRRVDIDDLKMKGSGDDIILKVAYTIHGPANPESKTGYFKYSYSTITGWRYHRETTATRWYLNLL